MQDYVTRLCWNSGTGQAITTDAVSENTIALGALGAQLGLQQAVVKIRVKTAFVGMDEGVNIQLRADTAANLTTAPIVLAERPAVKITELAAGAMIQIPIPAIKLPATYDSLGLYFDIVSTQASAGNVIAWIGEASESDDAHVYAAL